jgi:hypothetical protein
MNTFRILGQSPRQWLGDFRFWLLFFGLIRLIGITDPPLEAGHSWRQMLTNMVAHNFLEVDPNPLYPRLDMAGAKSGITGLEFPIFSYLIYLANLIFGEAHWYGRLINLVVSSLGVWAFYRAINRHYGEKLAFLSGMLLLSSIWFAFSRKSMPDTFSVALALLALNQALRYLYRGGTRPLLSWTALGMLALLSKLPAIFPLGALLLPLLDPTVPRTRKLGLVSSGGLLLIPVGWWYGYWVGHLGETYQFLYSTPLYDPSTLSESLAQLQIHAEALSKQFYFYPLYAFTGTAAVLLGIGTLIRDRNWPLLTLFGLTSLGMIAFMLKLGEVFAIHNYYLIPFIPGLCLAAGYGLLRLPGVRWPFVVLALVMIEGVANQQHDLFLKEKRRYPLTLAAHLPAGLSDSARVIVISPSGHPQTLYFADRKGWLLDPAVLSQPERLQQLHAQGAQLLLIDRHDVYTEELTLPFARVHRGAHYEIYDLSTYGK